MQTVSYTHLDVYKRQVIYEGKTFPIGTLACDALNVPADTISKMNEQCEKINLMLGAMNAKQDASALFPMVREAALAMLDILSKTPPFSYMDVPKHRERIERVFTKMCIRDSPHTAGCVPDQHGRSGL